MSPSPVFRQYEASKTESIPAMEQLQAWLPVNIPPQVHPKFPGRFLVKKTYEKCVILCPENEQDSTVLLACTEMAGAQKDSYKLV
jgi:hypothetical protein